MMYKRVLVTGSSGVLGSAFQAVEGEYPDCEFFFDRSNDCDLTDLAATIEHVKTLGPDAIIHLAAVSGGVVLSRNYPATLLRDNVLMTLNILEAARILQIKKLVLTLSSGMYPPDSPNPIKEEYIHAGPAHESNYSYSYAKRLMEPAMRAYRTEYGLNVIGLVPNGIFGPNDKYDDESATFIAALSRRFYENRENNSQIAVWGDGSPLRELTYSGDLARAFMWCLFHYDSPEILNVGTTEEHSIKDIAFMIADESGIDRSRIVFDVSKPSGVFRKSTDNTNFIKLSNFRYTPFLEGLKHTLKWLHENYFELSANRS